MQLFSIGLWKLHPDGTRILNNQGESMPTYSNLEITQMARVFTGLWFSGHPWGQGGWTDADYSTPMTMHADKHDFERKVLVNGVIIPARPATTDSAMLDIDDAIRGLFEHPNTGPFIGRQLIQFLVTDNPSAEYVRRVAEKFADDGHGVRGNLAAVVRQILLDPEAREPSGPFNNVAFGRLKEPVIRTMAMARILGMRKEPALQWWDWGEFNGAARQEPTYSPSVFNFYRPDYRAPGLLTQHQLAGPVFQITDSFSSIAFPNRTWLMLERGLRAWYPNPMPLDLSAEAALAATPERLVDRLNLLLCGGAMKLETRATILNAINQLPADQKEARARVAVYLVMMSPDGAVMK